LFLLCLSLAVGALNPALAGLIDAQQSRAEAAERSAPPTGPHHSDT